MDAVERFQQLAHVLGQADGTEAAFVDIEVMSVGTDAEPADASVTLEVDLRADGSTRTEGVTFATPTIESFDDGQLQVSFDLELTGVESECTSRSPPPVARTDGSGVRHRRDSSPRRTPAMPAVGIPAVVSPSRRATTAPTAGDDARDTEDVGANGDATDDGVANSGESTGSEPTDTATGVDAEAPPTVEGDVAAETADDMPADDATTMSGDGATVDGEGDEHGSNEPSVPVHRDPEHLRAVYDPDKTFKQMTAELGADVTPQTVRAQMIKHDIHETRTYDCDRVSGHASDRSGERTETAADDTTPDSSSEQTAPDNEESTNGTPASAGQVSSETHDPERTAAAADSAMEPDSPKGDGDPSTHTAERDTVASAASSADDAGDQAHPSTDSKENDLPTASGTAATPTDAFVAEGSTDHLADSEAGADTDTPTTDDPAKAAPSLPEEYSHLDVTTPAVYDAVEGAKTLYEVERALDIDRDTARELLSALDLLDLVTGRLATREAKPVSAAEIRQRAQLSGE